MKKMVAILISTVMTFSLGATAFAETIPFDLTAGNLVIGEEDNANTYIVTGGTIATPTHNTIIVNGAVTTTITLENVNIETTDGSSGIDIGDNADVELIISGENSISVNSLSSIAAGIHICGGNLTISGTDEDEDVLIVETAYGAAIGSNGAVPLDYNKEDNEDFTGTITIDGGVTINAYTGHNGAAIGSGAYREMSGDIIINGGDITAVSNWNGAGIGSGLNGEMSGNIIINDGNITSSSNMCGAGIGSGDGGDASGNITINGGTVYASSGDGGAGIGAGDWANMSGTITINGGDITAVSDSEKADTGAGIGAGSGDYNYIVFDMSGKIIINGGKITAESNKGTIGIGSGNENYASGDITINSGAVITLGDGNKIGAYNEPIDEKSTGSIYLYKGATVNGITVADIDELKEAGIICDNLNVELLEEPIEEPTSGHSYSLDKLNVVSKIKDAAAGDTIYIYESELSKGKLPYYVFDSLANVDNVTLKVVSDSGETAEFNSGNIPEEGKYSFFTVDELLEMTNN